MIAVTILGGYLGAGKTTLLNRLLASCTGLRLGVIVNDFGAINIDASLIESRTDAQINLTNGCICCTLTDGFAEAIDRLATADPPLDHLLVEASGVANVRQLAQYGHAPGMRLDGVLVVADAETLLDRVHDKYVGTTVRRQLDAADLIVLNKADLVTAEQLAERLAWLREAYPEARVLPCRFGQLPLDVLLGVHAAAAAPAASGSDHAQFVSWYFESDAAVSAAQLHAFSQGLDARVLRAKGTTSEPGGKGLLLQVVGGRREISTLDRAPPGTHLVAIGLRGQLRSADLDRLAAECF